MIEVFFDGKCGLCSKEIAYYQQGAKEIGEANGWVRLLSNSTKIVNILGGYGYKPALASMKDCVAAAINGKIV